MISGQNCSSNLATHEVGPHCDQSRTSYSRIQDDIVPHIPQQTADKPSPVARGLLDSHSLRAFTCICGGLVITLWQAIIHYDTARCCRYSWRGGLWSTGALYLLDHLAYCVSQLLDHALVSGQSVAFRVIEYECSIWIAHVVKCKVSVQIRIQRTD